MSNYDGYDIVLLFTFSGVFFAFVLSIGTVLSREKKPIDYIIAGLWFCYGFLLLQVCNYFIIDDESSWTLFFLAEPPAAFIMGPLLFFYFRHIIDSAQKFSKGTILHFIPGILVAMVCIFLAFTNEPFENPLADYIFSIPYLWIEGYLILGLFYSYSSWMSKLVKNRKVFITALLLLIEAIVIFGLLIGVEFLEYGTLLVIVSVMALQIMTTIYFIGRRYPEFLFIMTSEMSMVKYESSKIRGLDTEAVLKRMQDLMNFQKIYMDDELSLQSLSDRLEITTHQLSEILNERIGKNFNEYINHFRIDEAQELLEKNMEQSIISVAYTVGFNSKSSFNSVFKKFSGETPSEYRKRVAF
ncbi:MAG: AraC family transcriptional regulator [bacterium]|nr:AraC family transcriptional regulator [bacterium]